MFRMPPHTAVRIRCRFGIALARATSPQPSLKGNMMKSLSYGLAAAAFATAATAQTQRELDAHVHGVSTMQVAVEHGQVEVNLTSPGMDIVGFEYTAETREDRAAVAEGVIKLSQVDDIITLNTEAGCSLTEVLSHIHGEDHEEHGDHEDHDDDHGDHDDHDEDGHDDDHDDHDEHEDHAEGAEHSEFHVRYVFTCEDSDALTSIGLPFFDQFPNAQEIEAEYITETGAGAAEIERGTTVLKLD